MTNKIIAKLSSVTDKTLTVENCRISPFLYYCAAIIAHLVVFRFLLHYNQENTIFLYGQYCSTIYGFRNENIALLNIFTMINFWLKALLN